MNIKEITRAIGITRRAHRSHCDTFYDIIHKDWMEDNDDYNLDQAYHWYERLILDVLQDKLNTYNGCHICKEHTPIANCTIEQDVMLLGGEIVEYDDKYILSIRNDDILQLISEDEQCIDSAKFAVKIKYCPQCGREL